ncbi:hypothetical protein IJ531_06730 [bacterium]|nr:hypothetical protein [bacterium]
MNLSFVSSAASAGVYFEATCLPIVSKSFLGLTPASSKSLFMLILSCCF